MKRTSLAAIAVLALVFFVWTHGARPAEARTFNHDATFLFHDVTIGPFDVVNGDLNVIFGNVTVQGVVHGNLNVVGGSCDYSGGTVEGQINCVQTGSLSAVAPWVGSYVGGLPLAEQTNRLTLMLAANLVVFLIFLLFPVRVRLALGRLETHPGLAAVVGTVAFVAIVPLAILLLLSIVGIPLIVLELAAVFIGVWIGQGAIALLVGRRLAELVRPNTTPSPLAALVLGLVVVSAAEIVPLVGWAVTALISLIGLGAALLSFVREAPVPVVARPTIGGPPMTPNR
ncbi:MAG: hypothetical protein JO359_00615 [Candidatus Eremiobacteraeota bacterium]|nr:hypothetical protein [Candidatus Eremiobacteraeota bacterium]